MLRDAGSVLVALIAGGSLGWLLHLLPIPPVFQSVLAAGLASVVGGIIAGVMWMLSIRADGELRAISANLGIDVSWSQVPTTLVWLVIVIGVHGALGWSSGRIHSTLLTQRTAIIGALAGLCGGTLFLVHRPQ